MLPIFKNSYLLLLKNFKLLLIPILLDLLTFLAFGGIYSYAFLTAYPHLEALTRISSLQMQQAVNIQTEDQLNSVIGSMSDFYLHYNAVLWIITYFFLGLLAAWLIFQSFAWFTTEHILNKKATLKKYFLYFIIITFVSFILLIITEYIMFRLLFVASIVEIAVNAKYVPYIAGLVIIIFLYLTLLAYASILDKHFFNSFKKKLMDIRLVGLSLILFLLILLLALLLTYIVKTLGDLGVNPLLILPLILLVFPLLTYSRICLIKN